MLHVVISILLRDLYLSQKIFPQSRNDKCLFLLMFYQSV